MNRLSICPLDHVIELQLVKGALAKSGFCEAWDGMIAQAASGGHVELSAADKTRLFDPLRKAANDHGARFYVGKDVNDVVRLSLSSQSQKQRLLKLFCRKGVL